MVRRALGDPRTIFMNSTLAGRIPKNRLEEIWVSVLKNNKIDVRNYFYYPGLKDPKPTKKGLWLSFRFVASVISALQKVAKNPEEKFEAEIDSNDKEKLKVYTTEYKKSIVVHLRIFYRKDNDFTPGKGVSFVPALIGPVIDALKEAEKYKE